MPTTNSEHLITAFTTSFSSHPTERLSRLTLEDSVLGVHKVSKGTRHALVHAPRAITSRSLQNQPDQDGSADEREKVWEAFFPRGSINPGNKQAPSGGFGFYLNGGEKFVKALKDHAARGDVVDIIMGYDVFFEEGWEWGKGGKLPGICTSVLAGRACGGNAS